MNDDFVKSINLFVEKAKHNQNEVVRKVGITILARLVEMSPVGNPELWKINQTAVNYNNAVFDYNEEQRRNTDNLTKSGRLKRKASVTDGMSVKAPAGYTGGRFRGNWQVTFDSAATEPVDRIDKTGMITKALGNVVLSGFTSAIHSIHFTNALAYSYALEVGHSSQAPAGMIAVTAEEFQQYVNKAAGELNK